MTLSSAIEYLIFMVLHTKVCVVLIFDASPKYELLHIIKKSLALSELTPVSTANATAAPLPFPSAS